MSGFIAALVNVSDEGDAITTLGVAPRFIQQAFAPSS
jgi:hypothetical protein